MNNSVTLTFRMSGEQERMPGTCAIAVIAKAPRPGHVKTRLQGLLTPDEAARLGSAFLQDTLASIALVAADAPVVPVVAYAPAGQEARFEGLLPPSTTLLLADGTNGDAPGVEGFGRVLLDTTRALFAQGHKAVCVLGADSPTLPPGALAIAATMLLVPGATDAVLGRAEDGGYYLLGLNQPRHEPFANIAWSTDRAGADTRAALDRAGLATHELPPWYDVDDPDALARLVADLRADPDTAPATRAVIAEIGLEARLQPATP